MSNSIENLKFGDQVARDIETILFESPDKNVAELISKNTQRSIQNFGKYTEESLKDLRKIYTDAGNEIQHIVVDRGIRRGKGMPISVDETVRLGLIKKDIEHQISIVDGKLNNFVPGAVREAGSKGELMGAGELETLTKEIPRIGFPNFTMINKEAVEFSANYALETSIDYGHEALGAIKRRLDLAVVEGKAWGPVSREVRKIIIERSGQPLTGAHFKANRIVRTELARSFSSGHSAYGRACSFVIGETWHVTGGNVCSECLALDGKEYVYSKKESPPGPPLHPHCYTWDTEVYTDKGWKLFRKLTLKEKVYSIDPNSLKREYLPIINFVRYKFKGKMIHFNSRWIDLSVTPDHRMIYFNKGIQDDMDANSFSPVKGYLFVGKNGTVRNDFKKTRAFYNGYVYDIEVPKWHIILVRRGIRKSDRGVWSSNCRCYTEYTYSKNLFTKEEIERLKPEEAEIPGLPELKIPARNVTYFKQEMKKMNTMLDQKSVKETAIETKDKIVKNLVRELQKNKDFNELVLRDNFSYFVGKFDTLPSFSKEQRIGWQAIRSYSDYEKFLKRYSGLQKIVKREFFQAQYDKIDGWIGSWAVSSGDEHPEAIALQIAVQDEFGIKKALGHISKETIKIARNNHYIGVEAKAMRAFVRVQYNITQEFFKRKGIKSFISYRGMSLNKKQMEEIGLLGKRTVQKASFGMQPVSSFSTDISTANDFTKYSKEGYSIIMQSEIPTSRILSTAQTGWGCKQETEIVVLGKIGKGQFYSAMKRTPLEELLDPMWLSWDDIFKMFAGSK